MHQSDEKHRKIEREKARALRKTRWWQDKLAAGVCHFCDETFEKDELSMDHVVAVSRGGKSVRGNVVVACKDCNNKKSYKTPVEMILESLKNDDNET
ncbi:MAG: HNH endonuclease [Deltaproteobacteria bacterium]|jgi:5-methylcytosine-specific restriction enzyme A|nr:HNH endonuclease [Deltaproteobacteria bacterium]MBT6433230.1 HNH endonuclease [Deltaproteobacteria bacterium]